MAGIVVAMTIEVPTTASARLMMERTRILLLQIYA